MLESSLSPANRQPHLNFKLRAKHQKFAGEATFPAQEPCDCAAELASFQLHFRHIKK